MKNKFSPEELNKLSEILNRKKSGIDCTEEESGFIKQYFKIYKKEHEEKIEGLPLYNELISKFSTGEYQEAMEEHKNEPTFVINNKRYYGIESDARKEYVEEFGENFENAGMLSDDQIPPFEDWVEENYELSENQDPEVIHHNELCERIAESLKLQSATVVEEIAKMVFENNNIKYIGDSFYKMDSSENL